MNNMNKEQYISELSLELDKLGVNHSEKHEILEDFANHFADGAAEGLSESQICENLGDAKEIARQYAPDSAGKSHTRTRPTIAEISEITKKSLKKLNTNELIGVITLDVFLFSWLIPVMIALTSAHIAIVFSFTIAGLVILIASIFIHPLVVTSLSMFSVFFFGLALMALGGLLAFLTPRIIRGLIKFSKWLINLHSQPVLGRKIFTKEEVTA